MAQTTYTQTNVNTLTTGANPVDKSATASPNDFLTFSDAVRAAYATNFGGVFDFPTSVATGTTLYRGLYATNSKRLRLTSSVTMQNSTAGGGTFTPTSGANLTTSSANQSSYSLAIGPVVDPMTSNALPTEAVGSIGFVILSRTIAAYPLDLRATVTFNDGSTQSALATIGNPRATDDTFFGFSTPGNLVITNLLLQSFQTNTTTPVADRIGWDDFGFITKPVFIPRPPAVENISPANYAVHTAANGIQFQVR